MITRKKYSDARHMKMISATTMLLSDEVSNEAEAHTELKDNSAQHDVSTLN